MIRHPGGALGLLLEIEAMTGPERSQPPGDGMCIALARSAHLSSETIANERSIALHQARRLIMACKVGDCVLYDDPVGGYRRRIARARHLAGSKARCWQSRRPATPADANRRSTGPPPASCSALFPYAGTTRIFRSQRCHELGSPPTRTASRTSVFEINSPTAERRTVILAAFLAGHHIDPPSGSPEHPS